MFFHLVPLQSSFMLCAETAITAIDFLLVRKRIIIFQQQKTANKDFQKMKQGFWKDAPPGELEYCADSAFSCPGTPQFYRCNASTQVWHAQFSCAATVLPCLWQWSRIVCTETSRSVLQPLQEEINSSCLLLFQSWVSIFIISHAFLCCI